MTETFDSRVSTVLAAATTTGYDILLGCVESVELSQNQIKYKNIIKEQGHI